MTIKVTAEDIKKGIKCELRVCPIALACERVFGQSVSVDGVSVLLNGHGDQYPWYSLPEIARAFVRDFDEGLPVRPFEFEAHPLLTH